MVDCEFEGVADYGENERATRCQQDNENGRKRSFQFRLALLRSNDRLGVKPYARVRYRDFYFFAFTTFTVPAQNHLENRNF